MDFSLINNGMRLLNHKTIYIMKSSPIVDAYINYKHNQTRLMNANNMAEGVKLSVFYKISVKIFFDCANKFYTTIENLN